MSIPAYPEYRASGVDWLGNIPATWKVMPLKHVADFINGDVFKPSDWADAGIPIIRIQNLNGGEDFNYFDGSVAQRYLVHDNDLLFGWSGNRGTSFGPFIWRHKAVCALNQHIFRVVPYSMDRSELYWVLKAVTAQVEDQAHGIIGMVHITKGDLGAINIPVPSRAEQKAIALFLTHETAKIDALVEEQRRLIELLKEKRQAVISQAVTKGLDPNVSMKDSGVEWLGEVPVHWQVRPLKKCIAFQEGPGIMAADFQDDGVPLLRISCVQGEAVTLDGCNYLDPDKVARQWSHFRVEIGDLLISGSASMGVVSEVGEEAAGAVPYTGLIRLQGRDGGMLKNFIKHLVISDSFMRQVQLLKTGSTIQHFGPTHLSQMLVVLPPEDEQEAIAKFLTAENRRMDSLCAEAEAGMALLQERRAALISAAVTGKIDVRGLTPQPEAVAA